MTAGSPNRYRFTADDYRQMAEAGVLHPEARVELIEGDLIEIVPASSLQAAIAEHLGDLLYEALARKAMVRRRQPVVLDGFSVPHPDLSVVAWRDDYYYEAHPQPPDVLLVVEVAETTIVFDRTVKARLYARSGVPEVWLVDVVSSHVTDLRSPRGDVYSESLVAGPRDSLSVGAFADVRIDLGAIFRD